METLKAKVVRAEERYHIRIETNSGEIAIPISEDRPNEVKAAFNKLIARLKDGAFRIELDGSGEDLFSQVANEYITQLNREIQEVHGEMQEFGLTSRPN